MSEPQEWVTASFLINSFRRVLLLTFSTSGNTAVAHEHSWLDHKAEARKCELYCWAMVVVAMKPEVTDPVVCRIFRQHLLSQEPCPLLTWEHEHGQIKPSV